MARTSHLVVVQQHKAKVGAHCRRQMARGRARCQDAVVHPLLRLTFTAGDGFVGILLVALHSVLAVPIVIAVAVAVSQTGKAFR